MRKHILALLFLLLPLVSVAQRRFERGDFFSDVYLHFASHSTAGNTALSFDGGLGFGVGYDLGYKRFSFINTFYVNDSKTQNYLSGITSDGKLFVVGPGQSASFVCCELALGYMALDQGRHSLTPQLGLAVGSTSFKYDEMPIEGEYRGVAFGVNYRYHFVERFRSGSDGFFFSNSAEVMTWSIDFSFLMHYNRFKDTDGSLDGWSALLSAGIAFGGYTVR